MKVSLSPRSGALWTAAALLSLAGCSKTNAVDTGGGAGFVTIPPPPVTPREPQVIVDLRADVNRNGTIDLADPTEDEGEDTWTKAHGAIFLANIDDDLGKCVSIDGNGAALPDLQLPKCNDAADNVINGADDLLDLARMKTVPFPDAPDDAVGVVTVTDKQAPFVRLFKNDGSGTFSVFSSGDRLSAAELRSGVELAIEAKDIVRDPAIWSGRVEVVFHVTGNLPGRAIDESDAVVFRVSPVMTFHHLLPAQTEYVTRVSRDSDSTLFGNALQREVSLAGVTTPVVQIDEDDQWTQDFFEPAYMSMPGPGGTQHVIRVNYRSANIYDDPRKPSFLRPAGAVVFTKLRGKDVAAIQQFDTSSDPSADSLNSYGNLETIPPYTLGTRVFALGRMLRGSTPSFHPDASFTRLLEAQGQQPPVHIDTSWLLVGHVDETTSFMKAPNARGWVLLLNDPRLAKKMLEDEVAAGNGSVPLFTGMKVFDARGREVPAQKTVSEILADTAVMAASAQSAAEIDGQLEILKSETGLTEAEIIRVPFLNQDIDGGLISYQPGTVNFLAVNDKNMVVPDPHGPVINGKDLFKDQLEKQMAPLGITIHWVEDWNLYHRLDGEIHCGTNSARAIPETKWWETGR